MGFGASLGGFLTGGKEKSRTKTSTQTNYWTPEQQKLGKSLFADYLQPRVGTGLQTYWGQLPGTAGATAPEKSLFSQAGTGTGLFSLGTALGDPNNWQNLVNQRVGSYDILNKPVYEAQDTALKEGMAKMGLSYSSDLLKKETDVAEQRAAQRQAFAQNMYDAYQKLGLEANQQTIDNMLKVGELQRQIEEAGLTAKFQEWLRTRPEYSPVIDQLLAALGIKAYSSEQGTQKYSGDTFNWGSSGNIGF